MPIITIFLRDGVAWFLAVTVFMTAQMILSLASGVAVGSIMVLPTVAVYCVVASRVILNMKALINGDQSDYSTDRSYESPPWPRLPRHHRSSSAQVSNTVLDISRQGNTQSDLDSISIYSTVTA